MCRDERGRRRDGWEEEDVKGAASAVAGDIGVCQ
jgi:hypothetical protein